MLLFLIQVDSLIDKVLFTVFVNYIFVGYAFLNSVFGNHRMALDKISIVLESPIKQKKLLLETEK